MKNSAKRILTMHVGSLPRPDISHATNVLEHPEVVADRLVKYAEVVGREIVIPGTNDTSADNVRLFVPHRTVARP